MTTLRPSGFAGQADPVTDRIIADEGSKYTNDPADAGGPTKWGITLAILSAFRGRPCTAADVEALTRDEAVEIYREMFIVRPGFDQITDAALRTAAADAGVLFGPGRVVKALQLLVGVAADGVFGPLTVAAVNKREARELVNRLSLWRIRRHVQRVVADPTQLKELAGWIERAASFVT